MAIGLYLFYRQKPIHIKYIELKISENNLSCGISMFLSIIKILNSSNSDTWYRINYIENVNSSQLCGHMHCIPSSNTHRKRKTNQIQYILLLPLFHCTAHKVELDYPLQLRLKIGQWKCGRWWLQGRRNIHPCPLCMYDTAIKQIQYTEVCVSKPCNKSNIL